MASDKQIGGDHYKDMAIQPYEYCERNGLTGLESNTVKYVSRWRKKGGKADLEKAIHCLELLIELNFGDGNAQCNSADSTDGFEWTGIDKSNHAGGVRVPDGSDDPKGAGAVKFR